MEFILACSLFVNFIYGIQELKKYYLEYKKKKDYLLYKDE